MVKSILYDMKDSVAYITLYRPEVKNALNEAMHDQLQNYLTKAKEDDEVKVIVLQGTKGAFCSGADLKSIATEDLSQFDHGAYLQRTYHPLIHLIESIEKPTVAYLNGVAAGAGLSIALACDYRIADRDVTMALNFLDIGLVPDAGAAYYLPRIVGLSRAMHLALGDSISADDAYDMNLIQEIGNPNRIINRLKTIPQTAFAEMKQAFKTSFESTLDDVLYHEIKAQHKAGQSVEHRDRVEAFIKKK